ncbi:MAG: iron-containing redox enzyme family protein [Nitrospira sp.]|nr:iron-containing redox enzyme family protein [Nitrospira sp.]MDH4303471.1 iron-containing redox enzyme family protein [Nitrospira sp.]MDH5193185.1 iron-containing redox enzyme family protein [Nitrospira sp.]
MSAHMTKSAFLEALLQLMDNKHHWAWDYFASGRLTHAQLKIHFQQEYGVYVRDFPIFLARILGKNPPPSARHMLAENIYEEETGGLSLGTSHPELFLTMMEGLQFSRNSFERVHLLPEARRYRAWLDRMSHHREWVLGATTFTVFVEGSVKDRAELATPSKRKHEKDIESIINVHPLVRYHGIHPSRMDLIRAHQLVEAGHRHDAYHMVVNYTPPAIRESVLASLRKSLALWLKYRDAVAKTCGITKPS